MKSNWINFYKAARPWGDIDTLYSQLLQRIINRSLDAEMEVHLEEVQNMCKKNKGKIIALCILLSCIILISIIIYHCEYNIDELRSYLPQDGGIYKYCIFHPADSKKDHFALDSSMLIEATISKGDREDSRVITYQIFTEFSKEPYIYIANIERKGGKIIVKDHLIEEQILVQLPIKVGNEWRTLYLSLGEGNYEKRSFPERRCKIVSLDKEIIFGESVDVIDISCILENGDMETIRIAKNIGFVRMSLFTEEGTAIVKEELCGDNVVTPLININ